MISGIPNDILFMTSVLLIWFMLMYQFILSFAGYLYSRESARERRIFKTLRRNLQPGQAGQIPGDAIALAAI